jgi:hypothetical protein
MLRLWCAALAGPLAWTAHNLLSPTLVSAACAWPPGVAVLHALTALTLGMALAGALVGAQLYVATTTDGARFVGGASTLLGALFALVIVAEGLPNFILDPCLS